jgi:hypothetical protein
LLLFLRPYNPLLLPLLLLEVLSAPLLTLLLLQLLLVSTPVFLLLLLLLLLPTLIMLRITRCPTHSTSPTSPNPPATGNTVPLHSHTLLPRLKLHLRSPSKHIC